MELEFTEKYLHIKATEVSFENFYEDFQKKLDIISEHHIILNLSNFTTLSKEKILLFLNISGLKKQNGTSFVIINHKVNADDYPESLNVVPTFQEAEDILEMEAIERELGF